MALATRCPHCHTTFRVAQDQLKLRAGLVRCGSCREIFNGIENVVPLESAAPAPSASSAAPPAQPPAAKRAAPPNPPAPSEQQQALPPAVESPPAQPPAEQIAEPQIAAAPDVHPAPPPIHQAEAHVPPAAPEPAPHPPAEKSPEPAVDFADFSEFLQPAAPPEPTPPVPVKPAEKDDEDEEADPLKAITLIQMGELPDEEDLAAAEAAGETSEHAAGPADATPASAQIPSNPPAAAPARAKTLEELRPGYRPAQAIPEPPVEKEAVEDEPEFVRLGRRKQRWAKISRVVFGAGSAFLVLALGLQAVYAFRNILSVTFPQVKPALVSACEVLRCKIELPMQIDQVTLESSELQSQPERDGTLALNMLLRNRSQIVQAWPAIELTLNNAEDKPVARRVLMPRDYLPKTIDPTKGFPHYSEQPVSVLLDVYQVKPEGYRLYIFYP